MNEMMRLYVANVTRQHQLFMYFVPEQAKRRQVPIPPLSQVVLPDVFASMADVDYVIKQHEPYGFVEADKASNSRKQSGFYGLCYSVDRQISGARIQALFSGNRAILDAQGKVLRQQAAVAANDEIIRSMSRPGLPEEMPRPDIGEVNVTVQEDLADNSTPSDENISEGYTVPAGAQPPQARGATRRAAGSRR